MPDAQLLGDDDAPDEVLWRGRPEVGVRAPDVVAALAASTAAFVVLTLGLAGQNGWAWGWAAQRALGYAAVVAVVAAAARAAGAGRSLTLGSVFWLVLGSAALATDQRGSELLCPLSGASLFVFGLLLRLRQRRATRYRLTRAGVEMGERGRYRIAFPLEHEPVVLPDRFGASLSDVDFGRVAGTLTARDGRVFKVPVQRRRFHRVRGVEDLVRAARALRAS